MTFLTSIVSYLLGSIPFGYLIVRIKKGTDVRSVGSGNIGATNVLRAAGGGGALLTLLLDMAKGYLAVLMTALLTDHAPPAVALSAAAAILGHMFPVYLKFRGGKGAATGAGIFLFLAPVPLLIAAALFLAVVAVSRYVSLASILSAAAFPVLYLSLKYSQDRSPWILLAALFCSCLIIVKHQENIQRLRAGTERKLGRST
jgi:glycerol-3-phosphate acyltransferase PlsY